MNSHAQVFLERAESLLRGARNTTLDGHTKAVSEAQAWIALANSYTAAEAIEMSQEALRVACEG